MSKILRPLGHDAVLQGLADALDRDRLAHALLFTGAQGIGKALAARWLAARAACRETTSPCGSCNACIQMAAGTHPDLALASVPEDKKEIGIDVARRLKKFVMLQRVSARRKVVIIDEADRLSIAAQNALLKTLEEPPPSSMVILIASQSGALLPTVRSRCQRILFRPLGDDVVVRILCTQNGAGEDEARALAASAYGSPGRALTLRGLLRGTSREALLDLLADLYPARYLSVVRMAAALGRTEEDMSTRLELLLSSYRDAAVGAVTSGRDENLRGALRAADRVVAALQTLRRRNVNRSLLAEALCIELSRA